MRTRHSALILLLALPVTFASAAAASDQVVEVNLNENNGQTNQVAHSSLEHRVDRDLSGAWAAGTKAFNLACAEDASYKEHNEHILDLHSGTVLIEALKAFVVRTPLAEYHVKPKSLVLLSVNKGVERVLSLLEGVSIVSHKRFTHLRFGEEALITDHEPSHQELIGEEHIGVRQVRTHKVNHDRHIAIAEYSLIQASERIPVISQVIHSAHAHDRALKARLLKAAAVLNLVTSRHGHYTGSH